MYIIKGFKKNSGTLKNGKPWDNYTLFCLKEENGVTGYAVQAVKVPTKILQDTFPDSSALIDTSIKVNYEIKPRRAGDIATCYADPAKAREELDWVAEKTLEDMCKDAYNFIIHNKK